MKKYFVSGIGTDVGKTIASAILCEALQADYWKPIQAGSLHNTDSHVITKLISNSKTLIHSESFLLNTPASPHYAAKIDNVEITIENIKLPDTSNSIVIEGAGGLMVPLNHTGDLIIDLIKHIQADVILVSQNYLGSINHTLLTVEALRLRNINITGIIFNGKPNDASEQIILQQTGLKCLLRINELETIDKDTIKSLAKKLELPVESAISESLVQKDSAFIWHPYSAINPQISIKSIVKGEGIYLIDEQGNKFIDAISSWWVNVHGHGHPYITQKVHEQMQKLDHVIFAGYTHPKAVELADRLLKILPGNQQKIFFSDNGSTAIEVAIKMTLQYWKIKEEPKTKIIAFKNAYHGDTFGAMSVSGRSIFTQAFDDLLFDVEFIDVPMNGINAELEENYIQTFSQKNIVAFIFEPLVQGAGGMNMYPAKALDFILTLCEQNNIITIADEVMTGFGRTGTLFACEQTTNKPDIICVSKGITGGVLPLGITACSATIADAFSTTNPAPVFYHGHSYTANPISCAAACASLDIFELAETTSNIKRIEQQHKAFIERIKQQTAIAAIRSIGTLLAIEIKTNEQSGYTNALRNNAIEFFHSKGIIIRPLGNIVYVMPPYCISDVELVLVYKTITGFLNSL